MKRIFPLSDFFTCFCHICRPHRVYIGEGSFARILADGQFGKLQFIGEFILCTFLSTVTEKYQKNTAKGLSALWTPVFPIWVCLTEDIHGGGFEKRSA